TPAGNSGRWRELVRFSGTTNQTTPEFTAPNSNWRVRWAVGRVGAPGSQMQFAATVIGAETFDVAKTTKPGIAVMAGGGPGTYQLDVASSDARWDVVIEYR
ncbi:MAG TPA: hypothetical protein VHF69_04355, partial [Candidatus Synoicihabitans sp.]|nr:hypothetical protein [Candidatus Synoicihabitans sp.]